MCVSLKEGVGVSMGKNAWGGETSKVKEKNQQCIGVSSGREKFAVKRLDCPQICCHSVAFCIAVLVASKELLEESQESAAQAMHVQEARMRDYYIYFLQMYKPSSRGAEYWLLLIFKEMFTGRKKTLFFCCSDTTVSELYIMSNTHYILSTISQFL